jgi:glucose-1-phosphate cytidylyltransferase
MKAILLAGGLGTRLREETEFRPKPMVEVGGRPILWHIMKNLSTFGITDFIVATGYKSDMIKEYFLNYEAWNSDFTIELGRRDSLTFHDAHDEAHWNVTVAFTGETTMTGGRVFRAAKYLDDEPFLVTYGDGLADVDISALRTFHDPQVDSELWMWDPTGRSSHLRRSRSSRGGSTSASSSCSRKCSNTWMPTAF